MLRMARLAKREKVEVLSMGSEFRDAVGKTWEWVRVINAVRKVYKGKLTYIANHDVSIHNNLPDFFRESFFFPLSVFSHPYLHMLGFRHSGNLEQLSPLWICSCRLTPE